MTTSTSSEPKPARLRLKACGKKGLAHSLGRVARSVRAPSLTPTRQGMVLLDDAKRLGFR